MAEKVGTQLTALHKRAGYSSQKKLARAMGKADGSSVQRYFQLEELPIQWAIEFAAVVCNKGNPPIDLEEVLALVGPEAAEMARQLKGLSSSVENPRPLIQSEGGALDGEEELLNRKLDEILKDLHVVKDRLRTLELAVHSLQSGKNNPDPMKAGRTL